MKYRHIYLIHMISACLILLSGCRKADIIIEKSVVDVVFPPHSIGDQGYNDKVLYGLQRASEIYGFTLAIHIPFEVEEGMDIYEDWKNQSLKEGYGRSLFIFAGNEYENSVREVSLPEDSRKDVILFETDKPIDGVYTFSIGCYAASYMAGANSVWDESGEYNAFIIGANPEDKSVKIIIDGFRDGFLDYGGKSCTVHYLGEKQGEGYNNQEEAYKACIKNNLDETFLFSVAGSSNKGAYRYSREKGVLTIGMDDDMSLFSAFILYSVVKHIDFAINQIINNLLDYKEIPYHQDFRYIDGYEELVFFDESAEGIFADTNELMYNLPEIESRYYENLF